MEQVTEGVKLGRPAGTVKTEYDRNERVISLPQPGPGIFLVVHAGKVLEVCATENMHRYARQQLFSNEKVMKAAVETGDVQFLVIYRQESHNALQLARISKALQLEALQEKYIG